MYHRVKEEVVEVSGNVGETTVFFITIPHLTCQNIKTQTPTKFGPYRYLTNPCRLHQAFSNYFQLLFSHSTTSTLYFRCKAHKQCGCRFAGISPNHENTWPLTGSPLLSLEVAAKFDRQIRSKPASGTQER